MLVFRTFSVGAEMTEAEMTEICSISLQTPRKVDWSFPISLSTHDGTGLLALGALVDRDGEGRSLFDRISAVSMMFYEWLSCTPRTSERGECARNHSDHAAETSSRKNVRMRPVRMQ